MTSARLTIDLDAVAANWQRLSRLSQAETGATVKADAYGLGAGPVVKKLAGAGARTFFVALAEEGAAIRQALGAGPRIFVFSGHMAGDAPSLRNLDLIPLLNSAEQLTRHAESLAGHPFGIQLDTGMNRLGMEPAEWAAVLAVGLPGAPQLVMSHLACADEPQHLMNLGQLGAFLEMTEGMSAPRSLAATGGMLLGPDYHFDLCRPGIGLYGGAPYDEALPVATLSLPVVQVRDVEPHEAVGYSCTWVAPRPSRIATVAAGYADGLLRTLSGKAILWAGEIPCPVVGRVSMDLITVDVTDLDSDPVSLDILGPRQDVDDLAELAGTIGYEILTSLGNRYRRRYVGAPS
ncbi:alanine racemase [Pararhodobacter sp.]|uniref:alanine racemase n=1 Tax=Pararhodobacter sp. TaxID=2127056 RepID=UPI002B000C49|nr:alanine racemase [Pararhodobacter sp.]